MKTLPLLAACLLLGPIAHADEYDDLRALLGGREGKVVARDQSDGNKLYLLDTAARSVTKLSEDIECRQPLISPDGTRVVYGRGGKVYTRPLDGSAATQIVEGYDGHWWADDAGDEWIYYTTIGDNPEDTARKVWYPNNGKGIHTRRIRLKDDLDEFVFDWKCSAGPSRDGTHLGAAYSTMIIFEAAGGVAHVVNGNNQGCNGSMSPDDNYYLMHLELPHTYFCCRDKDDNRVWYVENPTGTMEWQSPEFSTHPDFATSAAKEGSGRYSVWVVQISTKEMVKILDVTDGSNWAEPHLWVGESSDEEYGWEPPDGGMGGDDAGAAVDDGGEPEGTDETSGDSEGDGPGGGCSCGSRAPAPAIILLTVFALLRRRKWVLMKPPVILCILLAIVPTARARGTRDAAALQAMEELAAGRPGVVCWQSRRTGPLRIFCCDLDGANLRQVSPDVPSKDHIAPLISPDGSKVVYYETMLLSDSNYYNDHTGDMLMVDADDTDGSSARTLVTGVRTYFECRFVRFIDDDRIAYIGGDHHGYVYSISQDSSSKLFDYPYSEFGALPNRQLTFAVDGKNRVFTINNPGPSGTLTEEQDYDGCEGNMTHDGLYAYRVKGGWPGHDFTRMSLSTWDEEIFFECPNPRLPEEQFYQYFPQISLCQEFLALGASKDRSEHAHWDSDYDIFIVPIDPVRYEETGDAVKYSFSDATDSYPDVWVGEIAPPEEDGAQVDDGGDDAGGDDAGDDGGLNPDADTDTDTKGDDAGEVQPDEGDEEVVVSGSCKNCSTVPAGCNAWLLLFVLYFKFRFRKGAGK